MSAHETKLNPEEIRIPSDHPFQKLAMFFAVLGVVGLALSGWAYTQDAVRFTYSWLFAFMTFLTVGLGALFFVLIQHLTVSGWSVTVRRLGEFFAMGLPVFALLFVPVYMGKEHLYEWIGHGHGDTHEEAHASGESLLGASTALAQDPHAHGAGDDHAHGAGDDHAHGAGADHAHGAGADHAHGAGADHAHGAGADHAHGAGADHHDTPQHALHASLLEHKAGYLNVGGWTIRAVIYFLVWTLIAFLYFRWSTRQDETKDTAETVQMQRWAPMALVGFGLSLTFAAFDWMMAMQPTWYSTIYGVYVFAGSAVVIHAIMIALSVMMKSKGLLGETVTQSHYHALGKLLFGFTVFWAYIGFSQMMLQWYASIPEEVEYYHWRWEGGWRGVSLFLIAAHFAMPFLFMLSRNVKRKVSMLTMGAVWMIVMHAVDLYWFVMPNYRPEGEALFKFAFADISSLLAVGGTYLAVVFFLMTKHNLIPVGDPRLPRALQFEDF